MKTKGINVSSKKARTGVERKFRRSDKRRLDKSSKDRSLVYKPKRKMQGKQLKIDRTPSDHKCGLTLGERFPDLFKELTK